MTQSNETQCQSSYESPEFWRALLVIYKHFRFSNIAVDPRILNGTGFELTQEARYALQILGFSLELATKSGWMEFDH